MNATLHTKFGTAKLDSHGYYLVNSNGRPKLLHRLIYEDFWGVELPKEIIIHHKDGNRVNNCILNLEAMTRAEHNTIHKKNVPFSESHRNNIRNAKTGVKLPDETKLKISKFDNSTGIFRVTKKRDDRYLQGFAYEYQYYDEDNKRRNITRVSLEELKKEVINRNLIWEEFN